MFGYVVAVPCLLGSLLEVGGSSVISGCNEQPILFVIRWSGLDGTKNMSNQCVDDTYGGEIRNDCRPIPISMASLIDLVEVKEDDVWAGRS